MAELYCRYCGVTLKGNTKVCEMCGAPVQKAKPERETVNVEPDMVEDNWVESTNARYETFTQIPQADKTMALASMICGIVGIVFSCMCIGMLPAVIAIVLGIMVLAHGFPGKGMAIAGIVTGGIAVSLFVIMILLVATA